LVQESMRLLILFLPATRLCLQVMIPKRLLVLGQKSGKQP